MNCMIALREYDDMIVIYWKYLLNKFECNFTQDKERE